MDSASKSINSVMKPRIAMMGVMRNRVVGVSSQHNSCTVLSNCSS